MAASQADPDLKRNGRQPSNRPRGIEKCRTQRSIRTGAHLKEILHQPKEKNYEDTEPEHRFPSPSTSNTPSKKVCRLYLAFYYRANTYQGPTKFAYSSQNHRLSRAVAKIHPRPYTRTAWADVLPKRLRNKSKAEAIARSRISSSTRQAYWKTSTNLIRQLCCWGQRSSEQYRQKKGSSDRPLASGRALAWGIFWARWSDLGRPWGRSRSRQVGWRTSTTGGVE